MKEAWKSLLARLRAWLTENERAHRVAQDGACCSAPDRAYAAQHRTEGNGYHE